MTPRLAALALAALLAALPDAARASHSDLAAEWTFSEESGDVLDTSGHANNGTPVRIERVVTERGPAILFPSMSTEPGAGDPAWVAVPAGSGSELYEFDNGLTLEAFIKPDVVPPVGLVASGRIRYILWADDDVFGLALRANDPEQAILYGAISCSGSSGVPDVSVTAPFPSDHANVFSHVALTFGGNTLRLFIDGAQVAEAMDTGDPSCGNQVGPIGFRNLVQIGGDETTQLDPFTLRTFRGVIDDVRIWSRALSPAEIADAAASAACASDADCNDGNGCTTDACDPEVGCSQTPLPGVAGARCEVERVRAPEACSGELARKIDRLRQKSARKVLRFLKRLERGPKPAKAQKFLDRAGRALTKLDKKLESGKLADRLDPACRTELRDLIAQAQAILASL